MKKAKRIKLIILVVLFICVAAVLLLPFSRLYVGKKLVVDMSVEVNRKDVMPYNITCTDGAGKTEKVRVVSKDDEMVIYIDAFKYNKYTISYDVDTPDGVKHITYSIMKTHQGGRKDSFWYDINLNKDEETGDWKADIWLERKNAEARAQTIWLKDDENAHVQYGP